MRKAYPPLIGSRYPEDAHPSEKQKQWALATCAVLTERNGDCHDLLGGQTNISDIAEMLPRDWGIRSREDLLSALLSLERGGHRRGYDEWVSHMERLSREEKGQAKRQAISAGWAQSNRWSVVWETRNKFKGAGLAGWDYSRYVALCGWGHLLGYLSEDEAWSRIMPVARLLQKTFSSWYELADNYAEGRRFWSLRATLKGGEKIRDAINTLLWSSESPWIRLKWDTSLLPEQQKDDGAAEFRAGRCWYDGFGEWKFDKKTSHTEAFRLFTRAAEKGNVDAMFWLALCHQKGAGVATNNAAEAVRWFQRAAGLGDGQAQYQLAQCYFHGRGVAKDKAKVVALLKQAVTNGGPTQAEAFLGWCYEDGYGVEKSIAEAFRLYQSAASQGDSWGQINLGDCYEQGAVVERSLLLAAKWYKRSAIGGHHEGMYRWAECLEKGTGTPKNEAEALMWYRKSAECGFAKAKKRLAELAHDAKPAP